MTEAERQFYSVIELVKDTLEMSTREFLKEEILLGREDHHALSDQRRLESERKFHIHHEEDKVLALGLPEELQNECLKVVRDRINRQYPTINP